jgi:hypothetical protein
MCFHLWLRVHLLTPIRLRCRSFCLRRVVLRLFFGSSISDIRRAELAAKRLYHSNLIPWTPLWTDLRTQSIRMGTSVKYSSTIHHSGRPCHALALYPTSTRIRRQLVWLCSQPALGTSHQDDCNSTTSTSTSLVHTQLPKHPPSRSHSLCSDLHRVALCLPIVMARQIRLLLCLWLSLRRLDYLDPYHR